MAVSPEEATRAAADREARREERAARRAARLEEREARRADQGGELDEERAARKAERATRRAEREATRAAREEKGDPRTAAIHKRIAQLDEAIATERDTLRTLTDLQKRVDPELGEFRNLQGDIDRSLRRIENLEERKLRLQERLEE
jgi:hypothetical protein